MTLRVEEILSDVDSEDPQEMLAALDGIDPATLAHGEAAEWYWHRAVLLATLGRARAALAAAEQGLGQVPDSSRLHFIRGRLLEDTGRVDEAFRSFAAVALEDSDAEHVLAAARYAYLWDRPADGLKLVEQIVDRYRVVRTLDEEFLFSRGLPAFEEVLGYVATFGRMEGEPARGPELLEEARRHWKEGFFDGLDERLARFLEGDDAPLERYLTEEAPRVDAGEELDLALLRARRAGSLEGALRLLDDIEVGEEDEAWLDELRILGRAEAYHRFGCHDEEERALEAVRAAQPLLFEPDHVFHFDLFACQERMKERYRDARRGGRG